MNIALQFDNKRDTRTPRQLHNYTPGSAVLGSHVTYVLSLFLRAVVA